MNISDPPFRFSPQPEPSFTSASLTVRSNSEAKKMKLKLLVHKSRKKVLFAEAEKDLVDFLFSLLALPLASVTRLLKEHQMVGSIQELYKSVENLNEAYLQNSHIRDLLLNPTSTVPPTDLNSYLLMQNRASESSTVYSCGCVIHHSPSPTFGRCDDPRRMYLSPKFGTRCPRCGQEMKILCNYVEAKPGEAKTSMNAGFVKGVGTYTVMDDLVVTPTSMISSITVLNQFQVSNLADLEERTVEVGLEEGLALLKASLESKTVLTDVFMEK